MSSSSASFFLSSVKYKKKYFGRLFKTTNRNLISIFLWESTSGSNKCWKGVAVSLWHWFFGLLKHISWIACWMKNVSQPLWDQLMREPENWTSFFRRTKNRKRATTSWTELKRLRTFYDKLKSKLSCFFFFLHFLELTRIDQFWEIQEKEETVQLTFQLGSVSFFLVLLEKSGERSPETAWLL